MSTAGGLADSTAGALLELVVGCAGTEVAVGPGAERSGDTCQSVLQAASQLQRNTHAIVWTMEWFGGSDVVWLRCRGGGCECFRSVAVEPQLERTVRSRMQENGSMAAKIDRAGARGNRGKGGSKV